MAALPMELTSDQTISWPAKLSDPALLAPDSLYPTQIGLPGPGVCQLGGFVLNKGMLLCDSGQISLPLCISCSGPEDSNLPIALVFCRKTRIHTCDCVVHRLPDSKCLDCDGSGLSLVVE